MSVPSIAMAALLFWGEQALGPNLVSAAQKPKGAQKSSQAAKTSPTPKAGPRASTRSPRPRPPTTPPPSRPDRALYLSVKGSESRLRASTRLMGRANEWEKLASAFRNVVHKYPRSSYCDDALINAGNVQREMSRRFKNPRYGDQALESYSLLVSEYPGSSLGESALFATYEILTERKQKAQARAAAEKYLATYPNGKNARSLERFLAPSPVTRDKATAANTRPGPLPGPGVQTEAPVASPVGEQVKVFGVRFWSGDASTRVVIDLDRKVSIEQNRLQSPPRVFVDLIGTRLHPNLVGKTFPVGNAFLKQIRVGLNRENVVRVVVDFAEASSHNVFFLADPARLVIDVRGQTRDGVKTVAATAPPASTLSASGPSGPTPAPTPEMEEVAISQPMPVVIAEPSPEATPAPLFTPTPTLAPPATPTPAPAPSPSPVVRPVARVDPPAPTPHAVPTPQAPPAGRPVQAPTPAVSPSSTPARNRDGSYSLARQLGLGARRIALDAGHGGHDPGAIGRGGTQEKDITLDIVLKLEKLLRTELGADVVLTRDRDVFIPLEERTAIANASGADLFLSVHINSARNRTGRGLETYYLSFAKNAAAEELAARENAISQATMKDLNNLVKAITTNSKIDESRDFAGIIQRSNIEVLSTSFKGVLDRGVHTAPFYVLIGANMPSILTEVGFISNPDEERWLKSDEYQEKLAEALLAGVRSYLSQLNRSQVTRLGDRQGMRVPPRGRQK